jgi:hypothetical protein
MQNIEWAAAIGNVWKHRESCESLVWQIRLSEADGVICSSTTFHNCTMYCSELVILSASIINGGIMFIRSCLLQTVHPFLYISLLILFDSIIWFEGYFMEEREVKSCRTNVIADYSQTFILYFRFSSPVFLTVHMWTD